ncbi:MAG: class I SAM-dependent methyltransferase [Acidobacteriota bacterium]|nr:class I SAM-dependent methyltransferase [Acidobacteriota bacterium]
MSNAARNSYDQIAERWHANHRSPDYVSRTLAYVDKVLEGVPRGSRVLDLGCGTGEPVASYLVRRGFRVVGVDQSEKMLEIARRVVPEAELIRADMVDVELNGKFFAAVAWDSVFHVGRRHHAAVYRKLADALEDGARLLLSVGGSDAREGDEDSGGDFDAEGFTSEMFGHTFFYSAYAPKVARALLEAAGFEIELWETDDPSSRGHITVIARRVAMREQLKLSEARRP